MRRTAVSLVLPQAIVAAALGTVVWSSAPNNDPFGAFSPESRHRISAGATVIEVQRTSGPDFAVLGATRTSADGEHLVLWGRAVERLYQGRYVPQIRRFSDPPRLEDLGPLSLDADELEDLEKCRPGDCGFKLSAAEAGSVAAAVRGAPKDPRAAALQALREIMLARAHVFLQRGFAGLPASNDHDTPDHPLEELRLAIAGSGEVPHLPAGARQYLLEYPRCRLGEDFLYWSKDLLGDARPIVSITHLTIVPAGPSGSPSIVAVQIFATHYLTASISVTTIVPPAPPDGSGYLLYWRRARTDVFDGPFGGLVRRMVGKRVRAEGTPALVRLRRTIESTP